MDRIIYTRADGGVSVIILARPIRSGADLRARRDVPKDATNVVACNAADIPTDRMFRDAWEKDASRSSNLLRVNMTKAREIHRDRLRMARTPKFTDLDGKWMKATATGDQTEAARCEAERQALRDLPQDPAIDRAKTPEELKALWPSEF